MSQGLALLEANKLDMAQLKFERLVQLDPNWAEARTGTTPNNLAFFFEGPERCRGSLSPVPSLPHASIFSKPFWQKI